MPVIYDVCCLYREVQIFSLLGFVSATFFLSESQITLFYDFQHNLPLLLYLFGRIRVCGIRLFDHDLFKRFITLKLFKQCELRVESVDH